MKLTKLTWLYLLIIIGKNSQAQTDTFALKLVGSDSVYWAVHTPYLDQGAIATKNRQPITYYSIDNVDVDRLGIYFVTYHLTDTAAHLKSVKRYVQIIDTVAPTIQLSGPNPIALNYNMTIAEMISLIGSYASATDNYDKAVIVKNNADKILTKNPGTYLVTFDATDSSGNHALQKNRIVGFILSGINEEYYGAIPFTIYPNPSNGHFQIQSKSNQIIKEIHILDALGRIVYQQSIISPKPTIDIDLIFNENGVCFLSLETKDGIFKSKLMLNK